MNLQNNKLMKTYKKIQIKKIFNPNKDQIILVNFYKKKKFKLLKQ